MKTKLLDKVPPQLPAAVPCKIAFVGEAPSDFERLYGFPLVGPSGRVFDQLLRVSGLAAGGELGHKYKVPARAKRVHRLLEVRAPYLVTNVFDEQLPDNDVGGWCEGATVRKEWKDYDLDRIGGAGYLHPDRLDHLDRLAEELAAAKPNVIVPLGSTALWAFTGNSDINVGRGTIAAASLIAPGTKIVPTYHPAHVQMDWRLFHVAVADLMKAAAESETPEVHLAKRRIYVRPTLDDLGRWRRLLLAADSLAVDIETSKQQITCICFAPSPWESYVVPFADYEKASRSYWPSVEGEVQAWKLVRDLCESAIPKTFQNGLYDCYYLIRQAGIWPMNYRKDTRTQHHALYPELPKSLAFMGATYENPPGPWKLMAAHRREKKDD